MRMAVRVVCLACLLAVSVSTEAKPPVVSFSAENAEVVIARKAPPVVRFAAMEATNFLSRVFGRAVPIVNIPTEGKSSLVLGMNKWARKAGVDPVGLPRDSFVVKTSKGRVFVAGVDSRGANPAKKYVIGYERGTLMGVYAFLEEYAGCRFYFPGELGEVTPRRVRVDVPETDRAVSPHSPIRTWHFDDGSEWDASLGANLPAPGKMLHWLRIRAASSRIPCCHGTRSMKLAEKYAATHPEYFALRKNGTRCTEVPKAIVGGHLGHLCYSSGVRDAIVEECMRRFAKGAKYVDIMPNDGMKLCECAECRAAYAKSPDPNHKATWLIWDYTRYVAEKLIERGAKGYVTQMVYAQYGGMPPDFDLPTNVYVMVAVDGPRNRPVGGGASWDRQFEKVRAWARKSANPVWTWTYPGRFGSNAVRLAGIPSLSARATGEYYKALAGDTMGTFAQYGRTDIWLHNYLNYYMLSHIMWNPRQDVSAIISEHNRLMFGAAERPMSEFLALLEHKWVVESKGRTEMNELGPVQIPRTDIEMWSLVYGPDTLARLDSLLKEAASLVRVGSVESRRIALFRRAYHDPLVKAAYRATKMREEVAAFKWRAGSAKPMPLVPFTKRKLVHIDPDLKATVRVERSADALTVIFDCDDKKVGDAKFVSRTHDDAEMWKDYSAEIFVNPSGDRTNYCHIVVNLNGDVYDERGYKRLPGRGKLCPEWNSGATAQVDKRTDGWRMVVTVPMKSLRKLPSRFSGKKFKDSVPMEFALNPIVQTGKRRCLYTWSPYVTGFHEIMDWGTVEFDDDK